VIIKLEESKSLQESWSVKLLRESLQCYIRVHKNARKHETNIKSSSYKNGHRPASDKTTHSPVEALMTNSKKGGNEQQKQPFYVFFVREAILMIIVINVQHLVTVNNSCHYKVDVLYVRLDTYLRSVILQEMLSL